MIKKKFYLLPLIILIITIAYATYTIVTTDIIFGSKHYLGILFIIGCVIGAIFNKSLGIYFVGITLLAGTLNFLAFTPTIETYSFGFGFNDRSTTSFKIQLFSFLVLLLYLLLNGKFLITKLYKSK